MRSRQILYLGSDSLYVYGWCAGEVQPMVSFELSATGHEHFAAYLQGQRRALFTLLVNRGDEDFQITTIPRLRGRDRKAVITRKLMQLCRGAAYAGFCSLGNERSQRPEERLLLAALTLPEAIAPWIEILEREDVALSGIHSLPFLGEALLKKLGRDHPRCLLLTFQDQSLRQSFFERGKLHFSRLVPHTAIGIETAEVLTGEAVKLRQYLASRQLVSDDAPLPTVVIADPALAEAARRSCIDTPSLSFEFLPADDCARRLGLKTPLRDSRLDLLYVHEAARGPGGPQFAPAQLRQRYRSGFMRRSMLGIGGGVLAACLIIAATQVLSVHRLDSESALLVAEAESAWQRLAEFTPAAPERPSIDGAHLQQIVDRHRQLERDATSPSAFYHDLAAILDKMPAVELSALEWQAVDRSGEGLPARHPQETATVRGNIRLSPQARLGEFDAVFRQFLAALTEAPQFSVSIERPPVEHASRSAPGIGDSDGAEAGTRPFVLQMQRRKK